MATSATSDPRPIITAFQPQKFAPGSPEALKYLNENGYVVFKSVAGEDQLKVGENLFWEFMEKVKPNIKRSEPSTWKPNWIGVQSKGLIKCDGIGQSEFMWYCRDLPNVVKSFTTVWGDENLLVSFDGSGAFLPDTPTRRGSSSSYSSSYSSCLNLYCLGWYHVDQNGWKKRGRNSIQGFLNFYPSGADDGGFVVVPQSHLYFDQLFPGNKSAQYLRNYVEISDTSSFWKNEAKEWNLKPVKICLDEGDLCLWDSRTIHCNHPPETIQATSKRLRRLVAYVCMTPANLVEDKYLIHKRWKAVNCGLTTCHLPHVLKDEMLKLFEPIPDYKPPNLTPTMQQLVTGGLKEVEPPAQTQSFLSSKMLICSLLTLLATVLSLYPWIKQNMY